VPRAKSRSVKHQYYIRASPSRVFRALTRPEGLVRWLADRAAIVPRKGGEYSLTWDGGPTHTGKILAFQPGKSLTLSWDWPGVEVHGTRFRLSVEGSGAAPC
jgi:uncharacterized protein YndB with AHSA1/START domain